MCVGLSLRTIEAVDSPQLKLLEGDFLLGRHRVEVEAVRVADCALHIALEVLEHAFLLGCCEHLVQSRLIGR